MDNVLDRYHLPKLNQNQINNLNRRITPKEIEAAIKSLPIKKGPELYIFSAEFYQSFKELVPILLKLFYKTETESNAKFILWGYNHPDTQTI